MQDRPSLGRQACLSLIRNVWIFLKCYVSRLLFFVVSISRKTSGVRLSVDSRLVVRHYSRASHQDFLDTFICCLFHSA